MVPDDEIDLQVDDLMAYFNVAGLGTEQNDEEGMKELLDEMISEIEGKDDDSSVNEVETALRIVGFTGPDSKPYSLVQLLQPMILVAKEDKDLEFDQRELLLSSDEATRLVPQLEADFKEEFEKAGLI